MLLAVLPLEQSQSIQGSMKSRPRNQLQCRLLDSSDAFQQSESTEHLIGSVTCCNPAMYEMRSHGFVTLPEAVISYGVNDVSYGVERSVISSLTDAATEFTAHFVHDFVRRPLGQKCALT